MHFKIPFKMMLLNLHLMPVNPSEAKRGRNTKTLGSKNTFDWFELLELVFIMQWQQRDKFSFKANKEHISSFLTRLNQPNFATIVSLAPYSSFLFVLPRPVFQSFRMSLRVFADLLSQPSRAMVIFCRGRLVSWRKQIKMAIFWPTGLAWFDLSAFTIFTTSKPLE